MANRSIGIRVRIDSINCIIGNSHYSRCAGITNGDHDGYDSVTMYRYATAMRAGAEFPPLLVDKDSRDIVDGNHTYRAIVHNWNLAKRAAARKAKQSKKKQADVPAPTVLVEFRKFKNKAELLRVAIDRNNSHGRNMTPYEQSLAIIHLRALNVSDSLIQKALHITEIRFDRVVKDHVVDLRPRQRDGVKFSMSPLLADARQHRNSAYGRNVGDRIVAGNRLASGNRQLADLNTVIHYLETDTLDMKDPGLINRAIELRDILIRKFPLQRVRRAR